MVLKTLDALGPLHGYGIARRIEQISGDLLSVNPVVLGGAVLTMALLGIAASATPALRALAVDPSQTHAGRVRQVNTRTLPLRRFAGGGEVGGAGGLLDEREYLMRP
jgi:hypothetical protein